MVLRGPLLVGVLVFTPLAAGAAGCRSGANDDSESRSPGGATDDPPAAPPASPSDPVSPGDPASPSGAPDAAEPAPAPYQHFDVNHVLSTGQSNAVAIQGTPVLSTTQPYANLMFDSGVIPATSCDGDGCRVYQKPTSLVPLVEGDVFFGAVETISSGLANETSKLAKEKYLAGKPITSHDMLVTLHGRSGNSYWCLRKGGCDWWPGRGYIKPFDDGMMEVADALALTKAAGKTYVVRAVTAVHGEHDHYAYGSGNTVFPLPGTDGVSVIHDYGEAMEEWQRDYETSVKAVTGQTLPVPLFMSQYSHWNNAPSTKIAYQQLAAHVRSQGKVMVVGPTYVLPYTGDCLHFTGEGERRLGEYFAKAYARVVLEGKRWEPLRPSKITMQGNVITVRFLVPKPPLVLDTQKVSNPGNYGFEIVDGSAAPPAITSVALDGPDGVKITLASALTGPNKRVRYAYTFTGCGGTGTVARGNLRDSDDTPSENGYDLSNWSVHFDEPVP
ncbi:hypothetical protein BH11MYX4_BH11MYX4_50710 [soil metagenome]